MEEKGFSLFSLPPPPATPPPSPPPSEVERKRVNSRFPSIFWGFWAKPSPPSTNRQGLCTKFLYAWFHWEESLWDSAGWCRNQRGGILIEYQAIPSLRDVHSSWRKVVYIYYITAAGNSISSQLGSFCQGNQYGMEKAGGMAHPSKTKSHLPGLSPPASHAGSRVGPAL
jgi:hypothetical protein